MSCDYLCQGWAPSAGVREKALSDAGRRAAASDKCARAVLGRCGYILGFDGIFM